MKPDGFLLAGACLLLLSVLAVALIPALSKTDPNAMSAAEKLLPPGKAHLFGTDQFGRDLFIRVLRGAGTTLTVAGATVLIGAFFGVLAGAAAGYLGGAADAVLMRRSDVITAFPAVLPALILMSLGGGGGARRLIFALGLVFIPGYARITRTCFASLKARPFILNARLQGVKTGRLIFRHLLPNTRSALLPAISIGFNNAVLAEAGMSYLGVGVAPPDASLGYMLAEAQGLLYNAPWYALCVCGTLLLPVFAVGLIGVGLQQERRARDA